MATGKSLSLCFFLSTLVITANYLVLFIWDRLLGENYSVKNRPLLFIAKIMIVGLVDGSITMAMMGQYPEAAFWAFFYFLEIFAVFQLIHDLKP